MRGVRHDGDWEAQGHHSTAAASCAKEACRVAGTPAGSRAATCRLFGNAEGTSTRRGTLPGRCRHGTYRQFRPALGTTPELGQRSMHAVWKHQAPGEGGSVDRAGLRHVKRQVAIRSPYLGRGNVTAVTWPDGSGERSFLLPTNLSESTPSGRITVATRPSPADRSLKVDLMNAPDSVEARAMAACYLAWVLRTSRCHVLSSQQEIYGSYPLRWTLNLGIPSAGYDDKQIRQGFRIAGKAAWTLSVEDRPPTRSEAVAVVNRLCTADLDPEPLLDLIGVDVVPEIVAEAARYAQSYERRNGLHFLVDVGASTIDSCGFVLHQHNGEDRWELLNALVEPLGALHLHLNRLKALANAGFAIHPEVPPRDAGPFDRIPNRVGDYLADKRAKAPEDALEVDRGYREQVVTALRKVVWDLKTNKDPHAPHWEEGLPVFITGGGGRLSILRNAIRRAEAHIRDISLNVGGFRYMDNGASDGGPGSPPGSEPRDAESPPDVKARLGVAYGLSLPDVGSITPPARISDVKPPPPKGPPPPPDYWAGKH